MLCNLGPVLDTLDISQEKRMELEMMIMVPGLYELHLSLMLEEREGNEKTPWVRCRI